MANNLQYAAGQVEALAGEKEALQVKVKKYGEHLVAEGLSRKALEEDMARVFQEGIVRVVDRVVQDKVATAKFDPGEPSAIMYKTHAMHASVKAFIETKFASYLQMGELYLEGLCQLCSNPDTEENPPEGSSLNDEPSSNLVGK
ncbi:unnamed protein product [Lactuca saligna]|uniref:Uncharacterized protein n=1 Tax=Lactuca saligna TaxID=75948 RepID=A0AA36A3N5_LACSI|nr:unnamed protein product [Lactuca saligna]